MKLFYSILVNSLTFVIFTSFQDTESIPRSIVFSAYECGGWQHCSKYRTEVEVLRKEEKKNTSIVVDADYNFLHTELFAMTTIENLSNEVIYIILQQEIISIEDVVSFGLTCRRFLNAICHNNTLWQMKVYQR